MKKKRINHKILNTAPRRANTDRHYPDDPFVLVNPEDRIQRDLLLWMAQEYPAARAATLSIPNGSQKTPRSAWVFRVTGLRAGASDLFIAYPRGGFAGLWLELKRDGVGKVTKRDGSPKFPEQAKWLERMEGNGYAASFAVGLEEAKAVVVEYMDKGGSILK